GPIEGLNFTQGVAQLERDLLAAFPNLVFATDETRDAISPYVSFSQVPRWKDWGAPFSSDTTPPVPVSAYVLPNVRRFGFMTTELASLFSASEFSAQFLPGVKQYEGQAVLPSLYYNANVPSYSLPDVARLVKLAAAFQKYNLEPAWDTNWNGAVVSYQGN